MEESQNIRNVGAEFVCTPHGFPWPSIVLPVQNHGLEHHSLIMCVLLIAVSYCSSEQELFELHVNLVMWLIKVLLYYCHHSVISSKILSAIVIFYTVGIFSYGEGMVQVQIPLNTVQTLERFSQPALLTLLHCGDDEVLHLDLVVVGIFSCKEGLVQVQLPLNTVLLI